MGCSGLRPSCVIATGAFDCSLRIVRRRLGTYRRRPPNDQGRAAWNLAYPQAYAWIIDRSAQRFSVPSDFVRAIAREESSFNPAAVSLANAYGLIQLILPTAKRWGAEIGLVATPATLKRAEINVPIGTRFMKNIIDRYSTFALIPPAYNAGPHRVDRVVG